jgi:hypothetical protein
MNIWNSAPGMNLVVALHGDYNDVSDYINVGNCQESNIHTEIKLAPL